MGYIGHHGVAALYKHKYNGVDHSLVSKYVMQPFWTRFVTIFPLWMAPNTITLIGFTFLVVSALLGYIYSPKLDTAPPRWVHLAHGMLLFLYQTFDAVDGKQARRTNSSSPLGELFDHGCDALGCAFVFLAFGSTAMSGRTTFWYWVIAAIPFYFATWEYFFTKVLILPIVNGPTEGLMLIYLCHFLTFFVGAEWWAQDFRKSISLLSWVPLSEEIPLYDAVLFLMAVFCILPTIMYSIYNVYKVIPARRGSMLMALAMLFPFGVLLAGLFIWCYLSPSDVMRNHPHLLIIGAGFAFGFLVGKLILAHLCDEHKGLKTGMCMVCALIGVNNMTLFHTGIWSSDQVGCAICCFSLLVYMSRMQQYFTASFLSIVEILEPATQIVICYLRLSMLPSLSTNFNCTIKAF